MSTTTANFGHDDSNFDKDPLLETSGRHASDSPVDAYGENRNAVLPGNDDAGYAHNEHDQQEVQHDASHEGHVEGESLGEHKPGESVKEWLAADLQQTKEDLHIGKKHD